MARPRSALSTFILSLPADLSVKEVVEKAKAKGLKVTENNVYRVRRLMGGNAAKKALASPSAAPVKVAKHPSPMPPQNKAEFVRALSKLTPRVIVEKAKAAGIKLDVSYVYNVRGKTKSSSNRRGRPVTKSENGAATPRANHDASSEVAFRKLVLALGLGRAKSLLGEFEAKLSALIAGR